MSRLRLQPRANHGPVPAPKPNNFLYYFCFHYQLGNRAGLDSDSFCMPVPIMDPSQIALVVEHITSRFQAKDPTGAPILGAKPKVVIVSWQFLRAWFQEEKPEDAAAPEGGSEGAPAAETPAEAPADPEPAVATPQEVSG